MEADLPDDGMGTGGGPRPEVRPLGGGFHFRPDHPDILPGELPHFAGINTFLKAPYVEDVARCGDYDVVVMVAPLDSGTTYRPGTRFGPQGIRRISALYGTYSFELGVDLRESVTIGDAGDVFTDPRQPGEELRPDQQGRVARYASGAFPVVLGGDHSIGYPTVRAVAEHLDGNLGIIHFDRHVDTQESDLDERMHTTPLVPCHRYPQRPRQEPRPVGNRRWQAPRPGVKAGRERGTTILTVNDCVEMGIAAAVETALEVAWDGADAVWLSFDVDCLDAAFVPGTGWPEPEASCPVRPSKLVHGVARRGLAGMEIVECSPPYDAADITSLLATRIVCDTLAILVKHGHLPGPERVSIHSASSDGATRA